MIEQYLTTRQVAKLLGLHPNTIKKMGDIGDLPFVRVSSRGDRRYPTSGVELFLSRAA